MLSHSGRRVVRIAFVLVLGIAIGVLVYNLDMPLLDLARSRQIQTADITRNFYKDGIDLFYPKVTHFGKEPSNFVVEFPLYNALVAFSYKLSGSVQEIWGRIVSLFAAGMGMIFFYLLIARYFDRITALFAIVFAVYAPIHLYMARAFMPDALMLALTLAALYLWDCHFSKKKSLVFLILGTIAGALSLLIKPTALYILGPLVYFVYQRYGKHWLAAAAAVVTVLAVIIPFFLWRMHATNPVVNPILAANTKNMAAWLSFPLYFSSEYYRMLFNFQYSGVLSSVGLLLVPLGISVMLRKKARYRLFLVWLASAYAMLFIFQKHAMTHDYYHLVTVPIAAILMAAGYRAALMFFEISRYYLVLVAVFIVMIPAYFLPHTFSRLYTIPKLYESVLYAAQKTKEVTPQDAVIIGSVGSGPSLVYYADRVGWPFYVHRERLAQESSFWEETYPIESDSIKYFESLRTAGAAYFVSANKQELQENPRLLAYIFGRYQTLVDEQNVLIFDLRK